MYLPFALLVAVAIDRRPSLLPYFMGVHFLMDAQLPLMVWMVSTGRMTM
jgi:membrane protease YdiL (CAAX protease family)